MGGHRKTSETSTEGASAPSGRRSRRKWAMALVLGVAVLGAQALGVTPAWANTVPAGSAKAFPGQSLTDRQTSKSASAKCPSGQRVLGGGAFTVGGVHAVITELQPIQDAAGDSFKVTAAADQFGIAVAWGFQVYAFCAPVPAAVGVQIVPHKNDPTSNPTDQARTECPVGKTLIGAGGKIDNGNGQVDLGTVTNSSGPFPTASAAFAKEDADGFAGTYTVTGYSICARANAFGDFQQLKTSSAPADHRANVTCPSPLRLIGLGGSTSVPGTHLQRLTPNVTNAPGIGNFGSQSSISITEPWSMETTVFCAK